MDGSAEGSNEGCRDGTLLGSSVGWVAKIQVVKMSSHALFN